MTDAAHRGKQFEEVAIRLGQEADQSRDQVCARGSALEILVREPPAGAGSEATPGAEAAPATTRDEVSADAIQTPLTITVTYKNFFMRTASSCLRSQ